MYGKLQLLHLPPRKGKAAFQAHRENKEPGDHAAAAAANNKGGKLPAEKAEAIMKACDRIISGQFHDQFVIDGHYAVD